MSHSPTPPSASTSPDDLLNKVNALSDRLSAIVSTQQEIEERLWHSTRTSANVGHDHLAHVPLPGAIGVGQATVDLLARQVERIDALARELGVEEAATAELVERVESMWLRLAAVDVPQADHVAADDQHGSLSVVVPATVRSPFAAEGNAECQPRLVSSPVSSPARGKSARTAGLLSLGLLTLFSAGTVALGAWNESGSDGGNPPAATTVPSATSTRITLPAAVASVTVTGSSPASTPGLTPESRLTPPLRPSGTPPDRPTRAEAQATPTVARARPSPSPRPSPTPSPTPTVAATSTPPRQVAVADLSVGVGSSGAEVERSLGDREYVLDGQSYYLDGQVGIDFDEGFASSITVTYPEPVESLSEVNDLLDRLRPADARLLDTVSEPDATLRRVYASEEMQEVFGDDNRYIERVRFDSDSGDVIGVVLSVNEE